MRKYNSFDYAVEELLKEIEKFKELEKLKNSLLEKII